ncbi:hypothetical protein J2Z21_004909 [Streptomyces griseochromogenes]|uniref:Uncharacterized protein n=1 Tax=Streptomyces griseochromogenes TaxID=68214 RepID=A0ABS4LXI9_9ACTN|nr:hypothetical protein [Streptomyces griseochromogenes]
MDVLGLGCSEPLGEFGGCVVRVWTDLRSVAAQDSSLGLDGGLVDGAMFGFGVFDEFT